MLKSLLFTNIKSLQYKKSLLFTNIKSLLFRTHV